MPIKTTGRNHKALLEQPKSGTRATPKAGEDAEPQELSFTAGGEANWCSHVARHFGLKQSILPTYGPAAGLLGIYPKESRTYVLPKTCAWMLIAALFTKAQTWKQPRTVGEQINKPRLIQTTEYHLSLKRNEPSSQEKTWRKPKCL